MTVSPARIVCKSVGAVGTVGTNCYKHWNINNIMEPHIKK